MRFLDEQNGIRRDVNTLMIGSAAVTADEKGDISIGGKRFKGRRGLWELLTRKNVNSDVITNSDLNVYKLILVLTNAHLVGYEPGGDIQITRGAKYAKVISELLSSESPSPSRCITAMMATTKSRIAATKSMMANTRRLYYTPSLSSIFSTVKKIAAATETKSKHAVKAWLLKEESYTLHRPVRKRFHRNPYTVTNVMDVWECDLTDMQSLSKYNDKYK